MGFAFHINGTTIEATAHHNVLSVYNILVDIIRLAKIKTSIGANATEQVPYHNLPAAIRWSKGSEKLMFDKTTWYRDATMRCRYCDIKTTDKVRYLGKDFEIVDIINFRNLNKRLVITLKRLE